MKTAKQKAAQQKFKKMIVKAKAIYKKGGTWKAAIKKAC